MRFYFSCFLLLLTTHCVLADINKCIDNSGKSYFTNEDCRAGENKELTNTQPINLVKSVQGIYEFENANYWSDELQVIYKVYNRHACAKLCEDEDKCHVASYHSHEVKGWENTCVLRESASGKRLNQKGIVSWVK